MTGVKQFWPGLLVTVLAFATVLPALAQSIVVPPPAATASPSPNATTTAFTALVNGNYLAAIEGLKAAAVAGDASAESSLEQVEPFVTGYPALPTPRAGDPDLLPETIVRIRQAGRGNCRYRRACARNANCHSQRSA